MLGSRGRKGRGCCVGGQPEGGGGGWGVESRQQGWSRAGEEERGGWGAPGGTASP